MQHQAREKTTLMRPLLFALITCVMTAGAFSQGEAPAVFSTPQLIPVNETNVAKLVSERKGKVVVLSFWATWCTPCIEEFPHLLKLRKTFRGRGLEVVLVSVDHPVKKRNEVIDFLRKHRVDFPTSIKDTRKDDAFITAVSPDWSGALPANFIYDRTGRLVRSLVDEQTYEDLEAAVLPLLKE
jgi:thiol-disulfide isomerase/thioredoxin